MSAPPSGVAACCSFPSLFPSSAAGVFACRGSGRINCGFARAASAMRWYVSSGMVAQMESGLPAWRRRQSASISLGGRVRIFSMSRKELRGLMPGVCPETAFAAAATEGEDADDDEDDADVDVDEGDGGGGGEKGVFDSAFVLLLAEDFSSSGATAEALRRYSSILSLYASFNDSIESWPSLDKNKQKTSVYVSGQSIEEGVMLTPLPSCAACPCTSLGCARDRDAWRGNARRALGPIVSAAARGEPASCPGTSGGSGVSAIGGMTW